MSTAGQWGCSHTYIHPKVKNQNNNTTHPLVNLARFLSYWLISGPLITLKIASHLMICKSYISFSLVGINTDKFGNILFKVFT